MGKVDYQKGIIEEIKLISPEELEACQKHLISYGGAARIEKVVEFLTDLNQDFTLLNHKIRQFNQAKSSEEKQHVLTELRNLVQEIGERHSTHYFIEFPFYEKKIEQKLFLAITYQRQHYPDVTRPLPANAKEKMVDMIEGMHPKDLEMFCSELRRYRIESAALKRHSSEVVRLDETVLPTSLHPFLRDHRITFLGGSNSINFLAQPLDGTPSFVFKLENRLSQPKSTTSYVRTTDLESTLTQEYIDRTVTYSIDLPQDPITGAPRQERVANRMVITDHCTGSDLETYAQKIPQEKMALSTLSIYTQMARTFQKLQEHHLCFPDSKNTNWLIENGKLKIADTKSFLFTENDKLIKGGKNKGHGLLRTPNFIPPEFKKDKRGLLHLEESTHLSVDAIHAYILGRNLERFYYYSNTISSEIITIYRRLQAKNPADRMTINQALYHLMNLQKEEIFKQIRDQVYEDEDVEIKQLLQNAEKSFRSANTEDKLKLLENLQGTLKKLSDYKVKAIFDPIFARLDKEKADSKIMKIKTALGKIPLSERGDLLDSIKNKALHEALAEHRGNKFPLLWEKKQFKRDQQGDIDKKSAAQSFKDFKANYTKKLQTEAEPVLPSSPKIK